MDEFKVLSDLVMSVRRTWTVENMIFFIGTMVIVCAMTIFMRLGHERYDGAGLIVIGLAYAGVLQAVGWSLRLRDEFVSGSFVSAAGVLVTPLIVHGCQLVSGTWPSDARMSELFQSIYVKSRRRSRSFCVPAESATLIVGLVTLFAVPSGIVSIPVVLSAWYLAVDSLFALKSKVASTKLRRRDMENVSKLFGTIVCGCSLVCDHLFPGNGQTVWAWLIACLIIFMSTFRTFLHHPGHYVDNPVLYIVCSFTCASLGWWVRSLPAIALGCMLFVIFITVNAKRCAQLPFLQYSALAIAAATTRGIQSVIGQACVEFVALFSAACVMHTVFRRVSKRKGDQECSPRGLVAAEAAAGLRAVVGALAVALVRDMPHPLTGTGFSAFGLFRAGTAAPVPFLSRQLSVSLLFIVDQVLCCLDSTAAAPSSMVAMFFVARSCLGAAVYSISTSSVAAGVQSLVPEGVVGWGVPLALDYARLLSMLGLIYVVAHCASTFALVTNKDAVACPTHTLVFAAAAMFVRASVLGNKVVFPFVLSMIIANVSAASQGLLARSIYLGVNALLLPLATLINDGQLAAPLVVAIFILIGVEWRKTLACAGWISVIGVTVLVLGHACGEYRREVVEWSVTLLFTGDQTAWGIYVGVLLALACLSSALTAVDVDDGSPALLHVRELRSVKPKDPTRKGLSFQIRVDRAKSMAFDQCYLHMDNDKFWEVVRAQYGDLMISIFRATFYPIPLIPRYLPATVKDPDKEEFIFDVGRTIRAYLAKMQCDGDHPIQARVSYTGAQSGVLMRFTVVPSQLLAQSGDNLIC